MTERSSFEMPDDEAFDAMRLVADPEADEIVAEVYGGGRSSVVRFNRQMASIGRNGDKLPTGLSEAARHFFEGGQGIGSAEEGWDQARLERGAHFFKRTGLWMPFALQFGTMPVLYAGANGIKVLAATGRLTHYAARRSVDTAQMVFDAMHHSGFRARGWGIRSSQKVRLMHAAVRHLIWQRGTWDTAQWGEPINQEDLLGTLGGFSVVPIQVMRRFGVPVSDSEADDCFYRWRAVAPLMGIRVVPETFAQMEMVFARTGERQFVWSEEGQILTDAWLSALKLTLPGILHGAVEPAMRHAVGDRVGEVLGLEPLNPHAKMTLERVLEVFESIRVVSSHAPGLKRAFTLLSRGFVKTQMGIQQGFKRVPYVLPVPKARAQHSPRAPDRGRTHTS